MTADPVWFGKQESPLFGWLHKPVHESAGIAVVVCNSLGMEAHVARRAVRALCEELSEVNVTALRFDYDGTGDSAGRLENPARVSAWLHSIDAAIDHLRDAGFESVVVVGIRMGASLAASAAARRSDVDLLVLWDPCSSGESFIREQTLAFYLMQPDIASPADGTIEGPWYEFSPTTADDIRKLRVTVPISSGIRRVLAITRSGEPIAGATWRWLDDTDTQYVKGAEQTSLLHHEIEKSSIPEATIGKIRSWIVDNAFVSHEPSRTHTAGSRRVATALVDERGTTEHAIVVGDTPLFAMVTEPSRESDTAIMFLNVGSLDHVGPGRLWTDFARRLALRDLRSLRIDLRGIGDSGSPGLRSAKLTTADALTDIAELSRALDPSGGSRLVFVGVSSGAYYASRAVRLVSPAALCLINPGLPVEMREAERQRADTSPGLGDWRSGLASAKWSTRMRFRLQSRATSWVLLARAGRRRTPILLITGESDTRSFDPAWRLTRMLLERRGQLRAVYLPYNDHSFESRQMRDAIEELVSNWIDDLALVTVPASEPLEAT